MGGLAPKCVVLKHFAVLDHFLMLHIPFPALPAGVPTISVAGVFVVSRVSLFPAPATCAPIEEANMQQ